MRKLNGTRKLSWKNPLTDVPLKPYLESPIFPSARGSHEDKRAGEILRRFYAAERLAGDEDARTFLNFVRNPDRQAFVIWGDIGIGKSWFLRYQLSLLESTYPGSFYYGVIDMLRACPSDAQERLEKQIIDILEDYFRDTLGGLENGLRPYAEFKARRRFGDKESEAVRREVEFIIKEVLDSRNSERVDSLLDAVEIASGPPLYIAVDNLDRAVGEDQHLLSERVARRLRNSRIFIIFSLRVSSRILLDDSKILGFFEKSEMTLSAVDFVPLLKPRFAKAKAGEDLTEVKIPLGIRQSEETTTFPLLLEGFINSEAGQFVLELAGTNSRKLLDFVSRILYSNQLDSVKNIESPESCIAALLMLNQAKFFPELSYILNLFDNNEQSLPGNALIRYRVLEFLNQSGEVSPKERRFTDYFASLGYLERVKEVVATFVGAGLAQTDPPRTADNIRDTELSEIGKISLIKTNAAQYFEKLSKSPWYFICAKNDIFIEEHLIRTDKNGLEFITDSDFFEFLKSEEDKERRRVDDWVRRHGKLLTIVKPAQPWAIARNALDRKNKGLRQREFSNSVG